MADVETFQASQGDITKSIDVPNPQGLPRDQLAPLAGEAFRHYLDSTQSAPATTPTPDGPPAPDRSFSSAAHHSLATLAGGLGATGQLAIDGLKASGSDTAAGVGDWLQAHAPDLQHAVADPKGYVPGMSDVADSLRSGSTPKLADVARAGVDAAAPMAGVVAGGAVGGPAGAMAASAAMNAGNNVNATGSVAKGLGLTALQAPLDAFGARGGSAVIDQLPTAALRIATRAGREGAAQAGMNTAQQVATTGSVDPAQVGAAAIGGAAGRAMGETPGAIIKGAGEAASGTANGLMNRFGVDQPMNEADARSQQIVADQIEKNKSTAQAAGENPSYTELANNAHKDLTSDTLVTLRNLRDSGAMTKDDYTRIYSGFDNAQRHNSTLLGPEDPVYENIQNVQGMDQGSKDNLKAVIQAIDTLSGSSLQKRTVGPLETAGTLVGRAGTIGLGVAGGNPYSIGAGLMGNTAVGKIGGMVGGALDKALGLSKPPIVYQGQAATRLYGTAEAAGVPSLAKRLGDLKAGVSDPDSTLFAQIKANRMAAGGPEVFDPANTTQAPATMGKAQLDDMHSQADRANKSLAPTKGVRTVPVDPANPVPLTANEQRTYDIGDAHALDRQHTPTVDEVGNPIPETPMNTPIRADGTPKGLSRARAAQAAPTVASTPKLVPNYPDALDKLQDPVVAAETATPVKPPGFGQSAETHTLGSGPLAYAAVGLKDKLESAGQKPATANDLREAVQHMHDNGTLGRMLKDPSKSAELADAMVHGNVPTDHPMSRDLGQALIKQVAQNRGVLGDVAFERAPGGKAPPGNDVDSKGNPIRSRPAYDNAARSYQANVDTKIASANANGFPKLATVIDQIAREPEALKKSQIATRYLTDLKRGRSGLSKAELSFAQTVLSTSGQLMKGIVR